MRIIGTLYSETEASTTRIYQAEDYDLQSTVVYSYDRQFLEDRKLNNSSGLYFLLWLCQNTVENNDQSILVESIGKIYIGQTKNVSQRILQHLDNGKNFTCACMFTRTNGQMTQTQTTFLEYLAIKEAVECGQVYLMDNYQLPKKPAIEPDDEVKMRNLFGIIKLMTEYAGYKGIFRKKRLMLKNDEYNTYRKRNMLDRIISRTSSSTQLIKTVESYDDEETEVLVSYKAITPDGCLNVYVIPVKDGFMIMPGSIINQTFESLSEITIPDISDKVKLNVNNKLTVTSGFILPTLEDMSVFVNDGNPDTSIWQMIRQVVE